MQAGLIIIHVMLHIHVHVHLYMYMYVSSDRSCCLFNQQPSKPSTPSILPSPPVRGALYIPASSPHLQSGGPIYIPPSSPHLQSGGPYISHPPPLTSSQGGPIYPRSNIIAPVDHVLHNVHIHRHGIDDPGDGEDYVRHIAHVQGHLVDGGASSYQEVVAYL